MSPCWGITLRFHPNYQLPSTKIGHWASPHPLGVSAGGGGLFSCVGGGLVGGGLVGGGLVGGGFVGGGLVGGGLVGGGLVGGGFVGGGLVGGGLVGGGLVGGGLVGGTGVLVGGMGVFVGGTGVLVSVGMGGFDPERCVLVIVMDGYQRVRVGVGVCVGVLEAVMVKLGGSVASNVQVGEGSIASVGVDVGPVTGRKLGSALASELVLITRRGVLVPGVVVPAFAAAVPVTRRTTNSCRPSELSPVMMKGITKPIKIAPMTTTSVTR